MLRLSKRDSGIWRVRGTFHGVAVDQSTKCRSKTEARRFVKGLERRIYERVYAPESPDDRSVLSFADAAVSWMESGGNSTIYHYFDRVILELGEDRLADLTNGRLQRAATKLFPTQKASTINRGFFALVSVILTHAAEERMMTPFKIRKLKEEKAPYEWYQPEEIERLLDAAGSMRPLLEFHVATGARPSEAVSLKWSQVGLDGRRVIFWKTKGGLIRSFDLCERGRSALPERRGPDDFVFLGADGKPYRQSPDGRYYGPKKRLDRLTKRHGLRRFNLRPMRHTWATWQYSLEPDKLRLQMKGGWANSNMVDIYTHVASKDIKDRALAHGWFRY